jgi:hypothetical protein
MPRRRHKCVTAASRLLERDPPRRQALARVVERGDDHDGRRLVLEVGGVADPGAHGPLVAWLEPGGSDEDAALGHGCVSHCLNFADGRHRAVTGGQKRCCSTGARHLPTEGLRAMAVADCRRSHRAHPAERDPPLRARRLPKRPRGRPTTGRLRRSLAHASGHAARGGDGPSLLARRDPPVRHLTRGWRFARTAVRPTRRLSPRARQRVGRVCPLWSTAATLEVADGMDAQACEQGQPSEPRPRRRGPRAGGRHPGRCRAHR